MSIVENRQEALMLLVGKLGDEDLEEMRQTYLDELDIIVNEIIKRQAERLRNERFSTGS